MLLLRFFCRPVYCFTIDNESWLNFFSSCVKIEIYAKTVRDNILYGSNVKSGCCTCLKNFQYTLNLGKPLGNFMFFDKKSTVGGLLFLWNLVFGFHSQYFTPCKSIIFPQSLICCLVCTFHSVGQRFKKAYWKCTKNGYFRGSVTLAPPATKQIKQWFISRAKNWKMQAAKNPHLVLPTPEIAFYYSFILSIKSIQSTNLEKRTSR